MFWKRSKNRGEDEESDQSPKQVSRRQLLTNALKGAEEVLQAQRPPIPTIPILRPPGAVSELAFLEACTRCNDCLSACPYDAIRLAPSRFRHAAGTPMIDPFAAPCWNCEDAPCIQACDTGALDATVKRTIGIARLQTHYCLAHNRSFCTVCAERCPVQGAIELRDGKPNIVSEVCTGCGVCHSVCPAPANAIMIMPLLERPDPQPEEATDE